jgi:hypothetical protein
MRPHHTLYLLRLVCSLVFAILSAPSLAQMNGMGGGMGNKGHGHRGGDSSASTTVSDPISDARQQRFSELEAKLKLKDMQWPLWENYQEKISALNADLSRNPNGAAIAQDSAVKQIDRKADVVRNRLTALEEIGDAARGLYKALDAEQRKVADTLLAATVPSLYDSIGPAPHGSINSERSSNRGSPPSGPPPN